MDTHKKPTAKTRQVKERCKSKIRILNNYKVIYLPDHPRAMESENWKGYVYEHIVVAERYLGREIRSNEVVHHLDGDRSNNNSANLLVLEKGQHLKLHKWLEKSDLWQRCHMENGVNSGESKAKETSCLACGTALQESQDKYCSIECNNLKNSIRRGIALPTKDELQDDINSMSFEKIGKKYGVSGNSVRKWARKMNLL